MDVLGHPVGSSDVQLLRSQLELQGKKVILFAGAFKGQSGVVDPVKAFHILSLRHPDLCLVMLGDGVLRGQVEAVIRQHGLSNVVFAGRVSREQFAVYQQMADVVVTPEIKSVYNELGVPIKLLDCLASGRPTAATRIASHTPIVEDGINGFLVEPQDALIWRRELTGR